jgi:ketosteroid isomerase-like protein
MSKENAEIVRQVNDALGDGGAEAVAKLWHPEITWRAMAPDDRGEMHGWERVRRYVQDWLETFDNLTVISEELLDVGDDRVVAVQRTRGRARLSGIETDLRYAVVYTLREGKIACVREYRHRKEALEAVGLAE